MLHDNNCNTNEINYFRGEFVFSDESENFVHPAETAIGGSVRIRIRTARNNVDSVFLNIGDGKIKMQNIGAKYGFSFYEGEIKNLQNSLYYYFLLERSGEVFYYNKAGIRKDYRPEYNFKIIPGFKSPDWAKGAVMYQIYVDRFCNGDESNDVCDNEYFYLSRPVKGIKDWQAPVENDDTRNFYGGDIKGIMDKMAYLKELGVEVILLNPVFVSPSNHKYDIQDYDYVDPHFGVIENDSDEIVDLSNFSNRYAGKYLKRTTDKLNLEKSNKLLAEFITLAHENGMKVVLDGVFNHCGSFNKWLDKEGFYKRAGYSGEGAYFSEGSPYHSYFNWFDENWPGNEAYDAWWNHLNHPKLHYEKSPELYTKIMDIGRKWVSPPYNADGWRLDVAADLGYSAEFNHKFWKDFRNAVKEANPEAIIFAEHYGDPSSWLMGDEWDTVMNYDAFMEPVTWFFTGMEKHSDAYNNDLLNNSFAFEASMRYHMSKFSIGSQLCALNQLSNHDHSRFLTRTNKTVGRINTLGPKAAEEGINKAVMASAVVLQMTWPGAPGIYYGDEAGLCGWTDPDNRRTYPWGNEDKLLINLHKKLIEIRGKHSSLKSGSMEYLYNNKGLLSFGRWNEEDKIAVIINNNSSEISFSLPVWKLEIKAEAEFVRLVRTFNGSFDTASVYYKAEGGHININLGPYSSVVLGCI